MKRKHIPAILFFVFGFRLLGQDLPASENVGGTFRKALETASSLSAQQHDPAMRAWTCASIAETKRRNEPAAAAQQANQCMRETLSIKENLKIRESVQMRLVRLLATVQPESLLTWLDSVDSEPRRRIRAISIERAIAAHDSERAMELLASAIGEPGFPYESATKLVLDLPREKSVERRAVFYTAFKAYQMEDPQVDPKVEDFATMIVRFWRELPRSVVLESIDEVLAHARKDMETDSAPSLLISTKKGEASFNSAYQYRLFELLPILEELDPSIAKDIARDNPNLQSVLKTYKNGIRDLNPDYYLDTRQAGNPTQFAITYTLRNHQGPTPAVNQAAWERQANEIVRSAKANSKQALAAANQLSYESDFSGTAPNAETLGRIAGLLADQDRPAAYRALEELVRASSKLPPLSQCRYLIGAANIYRRMNDLPAAEKLLEKSLDLAKTVYEKDMNRDEPNLAFKMEWPSTGAWRSIFVLEAKIAPENTLSWLERIPDTDIQAEVSTLIALSVSGGQLPANIIRLQTATGPGSTATFPIVN